MENLPESAILDELQSIMRCDKSDISQPIEGESLKMREVLAEVHDRVQENKLLKKYIKELTKRTNSQAFSKQLEAHPQLPKPLRDQIYLVYEKVNDLQKIQDKCAKDLKIRGDGATTTDDVLEALTYIQSIEDVYQSIKNYLPKQLEPIKTDTCFSIWYKFVVMLQSLQTGVNIFTTEHNMSSEIEKNYEQYNNQCSVLKKEVERLRKEKTP